MSDGRRFDDSSDMPLDDGTIQEFMIDESLVEYVRNLWLRFIRAMVKDGEMNRKQFTEWLSEQVKMPHHSIPGEPAERQEALSRLIQRIGQEDPSPQEIELLS